MVRSEKISADISGEGKQKLIELCNKFDRSRGYMLERMINNFHEQTFGKKEAVIQKSKQPRFTPPTLSEASQYFKERGCLVESEVEKFIDFYEMKGWMVGKNKMKDWKAAVRNWLKGNKNAANKQANATTSNSATDRVKAALEEQRREFFGSSEVMGNNDRVPNGQMGEEEWQGSIIDLDNGDWSTQR